MIIYASHSSIRLRVPEYHNMKARGYIYLRSSSVVSETVQCCSSSSIKRYKSCSVSQISKENVSRWNGRGPIKSIGASSSFVHREGRCSSTPAYHAYYLTGCTNKYNGSDESSLLIQRAGADLGNLQIGSSINAGARQRSCKCWIRSRR